MSSWRETAAAVHGNPATIASELSGCLQEPRVLARFGFLYSGYRLHYWETFEMVRKLLLAAVPVFVPAQPYGSTQVRSTSSL